MPSPPLPYGNAPPDRLPSLAIRLLVLSSAATTAVPLTVVGKVAVGEVLIGFTFLLILITGRMPQLRCLYLLWGLAGISLAALAASAYMNGATRLETIRSLANNVLAWHNLTCFTALFLYNLRLVVPYAIGNCLSLTTQRFTDPDLVRTFSDYYQTVILPVVIGGTLLMIIIFLSRKTTFTGIALAGLAATSLLCDSRSVFLAASAATILYFSSPSHIRNLGSTLASGVRVRHAAWAMVAVSVAFVFLVEMSERGVLGRQRRMQVLHMDQKYNPLEYLLKNGRGAIASSYVAIRERPLIGHGPNANGGAVILATQREFGVRFSGSELAKYAWTIPTHSVILQGWVAAGFLGAVPWTYVTYFLIRYGLFRSSPPQRVRAWFLFSLVTCLWALCFSPLTYILRQLLPAIFAISIASLPPASAPRREL